MAKPTLGKRIYETREARGIKKSHLAKVLKVSPTAVWNWEENDVTPRPLMLAAIAKALGVTEAYLLTGQAPAVKARTAADVIAAATAEIAAMNGVATDRVKLAFQIV